MLHIKSLEDLKTFFRRYSSYYDEKEEFPFENFKQISNLGIHKINIDKELGGKSFSIYDTCNVLVEVGSGCPSTALCLAMHLYSTGGLSKLLQEETKKRIFGQISTDGKYIASISNPNIFLREDNTNISEIAVRDVKNGYVLNGKKKFVSGAPLFHYIPVYAKHEETKSKLNISAFLIERCEEEVLVENSWNLSGMRATQSHTLHFKDAFVPKSNIIGREGYGLEDTHDLVVWFRIMLCSVYLGIAKSVIDYILIEVSQSRSTSKKRMFSEHVQITIAEMKIKYETSYSQLLRTASLADKEKNNDKFSDELYMQTLVSKHYITKTVNQLVWLSMQLVGIYSMEKGSFLEKIYRDVRVGMFHPPSEEQLKEFIGKKMLGIVPIKR